MKASTSMYINICDLQVACSTPLRKHCKFNVVRSASEVHSMMMLPALLEPLHASVNGGGVGAGSKTMEKSV